MFLRDGQIETCTDKTTHYPKNGVVSQSCSDEIRRNVSTRALLKDPSILLLDQQHVRVTVYREWRQTIPDIRTESSCSCSQRVVPVSVVLFQYRDNPADDASRGVQLDALERWINGPTFLSQPLGTWPTRPADFNNVGNTDLEGKSPSICSTIAKESDENPLDSIIERFSSWDHLRKIMACNVCDSKAHTEETYQEGTKDSPRNRRQNKLERCEGASEVQQNFQARPSLETWACMPWRPFRSSTN